MLRNRRIYPFAEIEDARKRLREKWLARQICTDCRSEIIDGILHYDFCKKCQAVFDEAFGDK